MGRKDKKRQEGGEGKKGEEGGDVEFWGLKTSVITCWLSSVTGTLHIVSHLILSITVQYIHNIPILQQRKGRPSEIKEVIPVWSSHLVFLIPKPWIFLLSHDVSGPQLRHAQCKDSQRSRWPPSPLEVKMGHEKSRCSNSTRTLLPLAIKWPSRAPLISSILSSDVPNPNKSGTLIRQQWRQGYYSSRHWYFIFSQALYNFELFPKQL